MSVQIYQGKEITKKELKLTKQILRGRISKYDWLDYNIVISTPQSITRQHYLLPNELKLFLSDYWYLYIGEREFDITFLEWYAIKLQSNPFDRSKEILSIFKNILLQNKGKTFYADMTHTTSYKLYKAFLKRGLLEEISHDCYPNSEGERKIKKIIDELDKISNPATLSSVLETYEVELKDYLQYFYHSISFKPTDRFYEKYERTLRKKDS